MTTNATARNLREYTDFTTVDFRAVVRANSLRTIAGGDWELRLVIPRDEAPDVLTLSKAIGIPINVHVERWTRHD